LRIRNSPVPHHLDPVLIHLSFGHNNVAPPPRKHLGPQRPVHHAQPQHGGADEREGVVRVPVGVPVARGRDEGREGEEDVEEEVDDSDKRRRAPGGGPVLRLGEVQVDKTAGDEGINPGAGVGVAGPGWLALDGGR